MPQQEDSETDVNTLDQDLGEDEILDVLDTSAAPSAKNKRWLTVRNLVILGVLLVVAIVAYLVTGQKNQTSEADFFSPPKDVSSLIFEVEQSVVLIECEGWGTGFAINNTIETSGFKTSIVTNHHVIKDCIEAEDEIVVRTGPEHRGLSEVKLIRWDEGNDLAILEFDEELPVLVNAET